MKIKETVERDCCQEQDLKKYCGLFKDQLKMFSPKFCTYCGQVWAYHKEADGSGYSSTVRTPLVLELENGKIGS